MTVAFNGILHSTARAWVSCWKITRDDGDIIRVAGSDVPIWIGSEEFLPSPDDSSPIDNGGGADARAVMRQGSLKEHATMVEGLVASDYITEEDLQAGRYRGARVDHYIVDARYPFAGQIAKRWKIADIRFGTDGRWSAEVVSWDTAPLAEKVGEVTSATCRNKLFGASGCDTCGRDRTIGGSDALVRGEWQIGIASGNYPTVSVVTNQRVIRVALPKIAVSGFSTATVGGVLHQIVSHASNHYLCGTTTTAGTDCRMPVAIREHATGAVNRIYTGAEVVDATSWRAPWTSASAYSTDGYASFEPEANWFDYGRVIWQTGNNDRLEVDIDASGAFVADVTASSSGYIDLTLSDAPPLTIQVGDTLTLETGCDHEIGTGCYKFANAVNFRGEPTMNSAAELLETPNAS